MILFPCFPETEPGRPKMQKQLPAGLWMCEGHKTDGEYGRNTQATQVFSLSLSLFLFSLYVCGHSSKSGSSLEIIFILLPLDKGCAQ